MVEVVVGHEDLRIAEVIGRVAVVRAIERPEVVFSPGLEVGRCGAHHYFTVSAVPVVTGIIDIIGAVFLIGAASTDGSILLIVVAAEGQDLAQRLVVGSVLGGDSPDGVEAEGHVVDELLQIEHLEVAGLLVKEWHGVADASYSRCVIRAEALVVCRGEECGRAVPVLSGVAAERVVAACRQRRG